MFELVHYDLTLYAAYRRMRQKDFMDQGVKRLKICTKNAQHVIGIPSQRPGAGDFGAGGNKTGNAFGLIRTMGAQLDLHKGLYIQS